jgi:hypothetical protein
MSATSLPASISVSTTSQDAPAVRTVSLSRRLAIVGLVTGAALNTLEAVLGHFMPAIPDSMAERFPIIADHPVLYGVGNIIGAVAIPFMVVGIFATLQVLKPKAPKNAIAAAVLLCAGMWGFLAVHVLEMSMLPAATGAHPAAGAAVFDEISTSPWMGAVYFAPFLLGAGLGIILNVVAMFRTRVLPLWVPLSYLAFLVFDFGVGAVGPVDPHFLYLAGALGIAWHIHRLTDRQWANA